MIILTKEPRKALQFRTRKQAATIAKSIGWQANDATRIEIMGFYVWAIGDEHGNFIQQLPELAWPQETRS